MKKITVDTNVVLRLLVGDDERQRAQAEEILIHADMVFIPTTVFCEIVWVLLRSYKLSTADVISALEQIIEIENASLHEDEVMAGLELMRLGGDFADGVNEYCGRKMGGYEFATFDKKAANLMIKQGKKINFLK